MFLKANLSYYRNSIFLYSVLVCTLIIFIQCNLPHMGVVFIERWSLYTGEYTVILILGHVLMAVGLTKGAGPYIRQVSPAVHLLLLLSL